MEITIHTRKVFHFLVGTIAVLVLSDVCLLAWRYGRGIEPPRELVRWLDFDAEQNLPALFSTLDLVFAASLLLLLSRVARFRQSPDRKLWLGLSVIFFFLAIDEFCGVHEHLNRLKDVLHTGGALTYAWVLPYGVGLLAFTVAYCRFWWRLPARERRRFAVAGMVYVTGAIGMEMVGGELRSLGMAASLASGLEILIEESMEMGGIALFVLALLELLQQGGVYLKLSVPGGT